MVLHGDRKDRAILARRVKAANNGPTISAGQTTPWYQNSCVTSALGDAGLHVGIDAIGLIPGTGGLARVIGHQAGYVGVVADQVGGKVVQAVGATASIGSGLTGLFDTSPEGLLSTGVTVVGFIPGAGQIAAGASVMLDAYKDARVCVTGKFTSYRGKPEIIATEPSQIVQQK
jgi:hypothetical protein